MAKGFAILFMVWVHTTEMFGNYQGLGNEIVSNFLGGPFAAPVFMVCLGIGICYTKKAETKNLAKRGIELLLVGLFLNIFRYVLPLFVGYVVTGEMLFLYTFPFLFGVDILEFAGLAFLFFALVKKFKWSPKTLIAIAILASLAGVILKGTSVGSVYVDQLLGYIWGNDNAETYFPFLNWIIFPIFGYLFGNLLRRCLNKKVFYRKASPICGGLGLGYIVLAFIFSLGMYGENGNYYFLGTVDAIAVVLLTIGIFGFCFLLLKFKELAVIKVLLNMSSNINVIYCIQWMLIGNIGILLSGFFPENGLSFVSMTILAVIFLIISFFMANWYQKKKYLSKKTSKLILSSVLIVVVGLSLIGQMKAESYIQDKGYNLGQAKKLV